MSVCLLPEKVAEFRQALKNKDLDIVKLIDMSTEERTSMLKEYAGDNAKDVNLMFEQKLILKNRIAGLKNWAAKLGEVGKYSEKGSEDVAKALAEYREKQTERIFSPQENEAFLNDLADKKLGIHVSQEVAGKVFELSQKVQETKSKALDILSKKGKDIKNWTTEEREVATEAGLQRILLKEYVEGVTNPEKSIRENVVESIKDWRSLPVSLGNLSKSIVASLDDSFFLNQGINALFDPKTTGKWMSAFGKSFKDIGSALKGDDPILGVKAEIAGRPNALDGTYERMGLEIGLKTEESIPTTIPEKIPVVGRFFKASNSAYNAAALRLRADIADMKIREYERNKVELTDEELESLGSVINSFTGRGDTGRLTGESVNAFIFSVRLAKSKFDVMTAHVLSKKITPYAKKQAAYSLLRMIGTAGAIMAASEALNPGSTELDPRGTNFGKIRIGTTWYPTPLAFGGLPNLIARTLVPTEYNGKWGLWMKNQKGQWSNLLSNEYGKVTPEDIFSGYVEGKAAPLARALLDTWAGEDFDGNKSTPLNVAKNLVTPISVGNLIQTSQDPHEQHKLFNSFMQVLGSNSSKPTK